MRRSWMTAEERENGTSLILSQWEGLLKGVGKRDITHIVAMGGFA